MEMKIDLNEIAKEGITIEEALTIVYLESIRIGNKYPGSPPSPELYLQLIDKGLLKTTTDGFSITVSGYEVFRKITGRKPLLTDKKNYKLNFKEFWETFPSNDAHGPWMKTRNLRADKTTSFNLYRKIIQNGTSHEDLMKALRHQIKEFKQGSITSNRLTYMKSSVVWLRRGEYEIILEDMKESGENLENDGEEWTTETV